MEETSLPKTELLAGYVTLIAIIAAVAGYLTFFFMDGGVSGMHESITKYAEKPVANLVYLFSSILFLVFMVALSALCFLIFRFYHPVLGSFVSVGFLAVAVSVIISTSAALSFHQLLADYTSTSGYTEDMVAINMVSVHELKMKSLLIAGTFFGLSLIFLSILSISQHVFPVIISLLTGIAGLNLLVALWFVPIEIIIRSSIGFAGLMMILKAILLIKHSKNNKK